MSNPTPTIRTRYDAAWYSKPKNGDNWSVKIWTNATLMTDKRRIHLDGLITKTLAKQSANDGNLSARQFRDLTAPLREELKKQCNFDTLRSSDGEVISNSWITAMISSWIRVVKNKLKRRGNSENIEDHVSMTTPRYTGSAKEKRGELHNWTSLSVVFKFDEHDVGTMVLLSDLCEDENGTFDINRLTLEKVRKALSDLDKPVEDTDEFWADVQNQMGEIGGKITTDEELFFALKHLRLARPEEPFLVITIKTTTKSED